MWLYPRHVTFVLNSDINVLGIWQTHFPPLSSQRPLGSYQWRSDLLYGSGGSKRKNIRRAQTPSRLAPLVLNVLMVPVFGSWHYDLCSCFLHFTAFQGRFHSLKMRRDMKWCFCCSSGELLHTYSGRKQCRRLCVRQKGEAACVRLRALIGAVTNGGYCFYSSTTSLQK